MSDMGRGQWSRQSRSWSLGSHIYTTSGSTSTANGIVVVVVVIVVLIVAHVDLDTVEDHDVPAGRGRRFGDGAAGRRGGLARFGRREGAPCGCSRLGWGEEEGRGAIRGDVAVGTAEGADGRENII